MEIDGGNLVDEDPLQPQEATGPNEDKESEDEDEDESGSESGSDSEDDSNDDGYGKLKENFVAGGILDSQLESQQWVDNQMANSGGSRVGDSISATQKCKVDDNMAIFEKYFKKVKVELEQRRASCEAFEEKIEELTQMAAVMHTELMGAKNEVTRLNHILGRIQGAVNEIKREK
ncbi:hypothetical protein DXG01_010981 [Tephrocybe rancida]|nr:hypothetical protein DXG01_010981 [Tephrocybe rancida]